MFNLVRGLSVALVEMSDGSDAAKGTVAAAFIDAGLRLCLQCGLSRRRLMEHLEEHIDAIEGDLRAQELN